LLSSCACQRTLGILAAQDSRPGETPAQDSRVSRMCGMCNNLNYAHETWLPAHRRAPPPATRLLERPSAIYPKTQLSYSGIRSRAPGISIMKDPAVMEMLEEMQIMECQSGDAFPNPNPIRVRRKRNRNCIILQGDNAVHSKRNAQCIYL